jgi:hypothetical protein
MRAHLRVVEDHVDVVFRLTRGEYVKGCRALIAGRPYTWAVIALAIASFVVGAFGDVIWLYLGAICVVIAAVYVGAVPYWWWVRRADRDVDVRGSFGSHGITLVREGHVTSGPWSEVRRVRATGDVFLIDGRGPWFLIVPARAFGSAEQIEFFTQLTASVVR